MLFGLSDRNSAENWSLLSNSTRCASQGSPVSSSMIEAFTPLGVVSEYSCRRSGSRGGHLRVIGKVLRSFMRCNEVTGKGAMVGGDASARPAGVLA